MLKEKTIRCLVVDDEPPAREILKRYIKEMPSLALTGECANAMQALNFLQQQPIDLVFLDINMPQLKGTDLLKNVKRLPKVIFTTAFTEYALEGYELDVIDYLLKPIQFDRFVKAVHKALQSGADMIMNTTPASEIGQEAFVYFRADRKMVKVMLRDIFYIESMKDYIKVCTANGIIITKQSMISVEAMLPGNHFIRTHRSFIVSLQRIKSFTHEIIEVDKMQIPIGKLFRNKVMRVLN
jgi:two-component system, LytTR family, response regulator